MFLFLAFLLTTMFLMANQPKQPGPQNARAAALSELTLPGIGAADYIRKIYGTLKITDLSLARVFGYRVEPIIEVHKIDGGMFGSDKKVRQIVGHKYYLSQQF